MDDAVSLPAIAKPAADTAEGSIEVRRKEALLETGALPVG